MIASPFTEALRAFVSRRASGPPTGARPTAALPTAAPPRIPRFEDVVPVDASPLLSVSRDTRELLPGIDLREDLAAALQRITAADIDDVDRGLQPARGHDVGDLVFLDLETTGFWGCPVLLVGLLQEERGRLVTRQLVARDYPAERQLLADALHELAPRKLVVTFNGKSFDLPCFRERCIVHRVADAVTARLAHVDLLHVARRLWRGRFGDTRLTTLERHVVGITRGGDVPSREIPALFHRFVATGDLAELRPVLHHGRVDLLTTARLFAIAASSSAAGS